MKNAQISIRRKNSFVNHKVLACQNLKKRVCIFEVHGLDADFSLKLKYLLDWMHGWQQFVIQPLWCHEMIFGMGA